MATSVTVEEFMQRFLCRSKGDAKILILRQTPERHLGPPEEESSSPPIIFEFPWFCVLKRLVHALPQLDQHTGQLCVTHRVRSYDFGHLETPDWGDCAAAWNAIGSSHPFMVERVLPLSGPVGTLLRLAQLVIYQTVEDQWLILCPTDNDPFGGDPSVVRLSADGSLSLVDESQDSENEESNSSFHAYGLVPDVHMEKRIGASFTTIPVCMTLRWYSGVASEIAAADPIFFAPPSLAGHHPQSIGQCIIPSN